VNTDPLAALEGFTESVVVVAVCATATAHDIAINKAAHNEEREFFQREPFSRVLAFLEMSNAFSASPTICGDPIASERNEL
jgi:hypothetical protein